MKLTYLIGAGASAGTPINKINKMNGESYVDYYGGLPIVNEIPGRLQKLLKDVKQFSLEGCEGDLDYRAEQQKLIEDLQELINVCSHHATIDTYAKKLVLTKDIFTLLHLENILSFYFICEELFNDIDQRYDTFLANILGDDMLLPENINIVSWNYDNFFDMAYQEYNPEGRIRTITKNDVREGNPKLFKINGTATFENYHLSNFIEDSKLAYYDTKKTDLGYTYGMTEEGLKRLLKIYYHVCAHTPKKHSNLSFAFDSEHSIEKTFIDKLKKALASTTILVIIGYSFPFFNRKMDQIILDACTSLKKIYIQDINSTKVKEILVTYFEEKHRRVAIVPITDVGSFYIPTEYTIPHVSVDVGGVM